MAIKNKLLSSTGLAVAFILALLMTVGLSALIVVISIGSTGNVISVNIDLYEDVDLTVPLTAIDWGFVYSNSTEERTFYVFNSGNRDVELTLSTIDQPVYLTTTWDSESFILAPNTTKVAVVQIALAEDAPGVSFSYFVVVTGVEIPPTP